MAEGGGSGLGIGRDVAVDQPQLGAFDGGVAFGDVGLALAQRLDLGAFQHDAGLEVVLDEVVVAGLAVLGRDAAARALLFRGHRIRR